MAKQSTPRPVIGDLLKSLPKPETPVQEVRPVTLAPAAKAKEEQVRINGFWVNAALGRRFKVYGANTDKKPREILIEALEAYLADK